MKARTFQTLCFFEIALHFEYADPSEEVKKLLLEMKFIENATRDVEKALSMITEGLITLEATLPHLRLANSDGKTTIQEFLLTTLLTTARRCSASPYDIGLILFKFANFYSERG